MILQSVFLCSCKGPKHLALPMVPATYNYFDYHILNIDGEGRCNLTTTEAYYDGFKIRYELNEYGQMMFSIENSSNKDLTIDKSKCYVLYNGMSHQLFKDVRSGRVTSYNDVNGAISDVRTSENGTNLIVPQYSKWAVAVEETNIEKAEKPDDFVYEPGDHGYNTYNTNATIEFVIPYTFDYTLRSWKTCRNRLFIGNVHVERHLQEMPIREVSGSDKRGYYAVSVHPDDLAEYDLVKAYNDGKLSKKERKMVRRNYVQVKTYDVNKGLDMNKRTSGNLPSSPSPSTPSGGRTNPGSGTYNGGMYVCPCVGNTPAGTKAYHKCANCGKSHLRGNHTCKIKTQ